MRSNDRAALTCARIFSSICSRSAGVSGRSQVEVVVEAVADGGADSQLRIGEQLEHGGGHDVRRRMAHGVETIMGARIEQLLRL